MLSVALPLVPAAVGPFLNGLVPEGEARTVLEARYGVRRGDLRGLLAVLDAPVLALSRYDRVAGPDGVTRIHQEDVCQALAVDIGPLGAGKYEANGGPSLEQVADLLDVHNGNADQTLVLAAAMVLTVAVGNADAHGKNLSLLHPPDGPLRLAPLYDVVSTVQYPQIRTPAGVRQVSSTLAMRVNGRNDVHEVTVADLRAEARSWHRGPGLDERIDSVLDALPAAVSAAADETPEAPGVFSERIAARVARLREGRSAGGE